MQEHRGTGVPHWTALDPLSDGAGISFKSCFGPPVSGDGARRRILSDS